MPHIRAAFVSGEVICSTINLLGILRFLKVENMNFAIMSMNQKCKERVNLVRSQ